MKDISKYLSKKEPWVDPLPCNSPLFKKIEAIYDTNYLTLKYLGYPELVLRVSGDDLSFYYMGKCNNTSDVLSINSLRDLNHYDLSEIISIVISKLNYQKV